MFKRKILSMVLLVGMLFGQSVPRAMAATYCDHAQFVSDLTVPDGSSFAPGAAFTKTWRLMNIGTCAWTDAYNLRFDSGDSMGAPISVKLPASVSPGQLVDVSVNMTAPTAGGHYKGFWKLTNASATPFGIGDSASNPIWVDINVVETNAVIYDFVANAPYAQWTSGAGSLPFPGTSGDSRGFSYPINNPHLEDDSIDVLPGLLTVPQNKYNGYIQATYPEFQIQAGDKLQTLVNCEFGATSCYVTFRIDYLLPNGVQKTLWSFKEAYDKRFYRASLDLSPLAGQKVRFVFMLLSTGLAGGDRAIWGSPRIVRSGPTQPPAPPSTLTPLPALTPTATPFNQPPPTVAPSGCDKASFVADVTVPDGTLFSPGAAFTKTWRLKNAGGCTWTTAYKFLFYSGEQMGAPTSINLPLNVSPGQTVDLTVNMIAPSSAGKFRGNWILSNANGALFGIGANAATPIWVEINIAGDSPIGAGYDFAANVCSAEWRSGAGILPCPGTDGNANGFVIRQDAPKLEDGSTGAPGLLTFPQNRFNGYIQGFYPTFTVQPGDRFQTIVGCEFGASCYVTYRLDTMTATGAISSFWTWREKNEGKYYSANVDLSPLAGRSVRFILTILATGFATGDRAVWGAPRIVRAGGVPPTATPNSPATVTPTPPTFSPTPIGLPGPIVPSPRISKLYMIDSSNGWAIGNGYLLRTTDGGTTWYNILPEDAPTGGYFPTAMKGWAVSGSPHANVGSLYRTTNGGENWTRYDVPFSNGYIQFLDDNIGYILEVTGAAMNKQSVLLFKTTDGGATWVQNYNNDPTLPGASNSLPLGGSKNGMTFSNATTGWIGGETPATSIYLYKTADSGATWALQQVALPAGYGSPLAVSTTAPTFFGANDAVLPVWITMDSGRDLFIYTSHDGGATWSPSTSFARTIGQTNFSSLRDAISWDWANVFHVTNDSGNSWNLVTPNVNFSDGFGGMDFVSTTTGWVILSHADGSTSLYRTADGGYTWTLLYGNALPPTLTPTLAATPVPSASEFAQTVVNTLNARNFDAAKASMDQSFLFAFWQSQGTSYTPDQAIEQLQTNYLSATTPLTPDPSKDLNALLGGVNPFSIVGLDPAISQALFVSGWGLNGADEAILYFTRLPDGSLYWYGVLIAVGGFHIP